MIKICDLHFSRLDEIVASFLVEVGEEVILVETGPYSTFTDLTRGLRQQGKSIDDITKVFLTHIHLDHAGAAWAVAEGAIKPKIYVHPRGYPHLIDPTKLVGSATMIYGDDMERLWSTINPISESQLEAVEHQSVIELGDDWKMVSHHTPGHASHHIAWELKQGDEPGWIFAGDVAGVKIGDGPVEVPLPPPDIDLDAWKNSLELLKSLKPKNLFLTHFGQVDQIDEHLDQVNKSLDRNYQWFKEKIQAEISKEQSKEQLLEDYIKYVKEHLKANFQSDERIEQYQSSNPSFMSVMGMQRFFKKFEGLE